MDLKIVGGTTPKAVIYKNESHKLAHSFPVATGKVVVPGRPVVLLADGTIRGFEAGDSLSRVIGIAATSSVTPAYTASRQYGVVEVTVFVKGYAIVYGVAAEAITAGGVKPEGTMESTGRYAKYEPLAAATAYTPAGVDPVADPAVEATPADATMFIALNAADEDELVHILVL